MFAQIELMGIRNKANYYIRQDETDGKKKDQTKLGFLTWLHYNGLLRDFVKTLIAYGFHPDIDSKNPLIHHFRDFYEVWNRVVKEKKDPDPKHKEMFTSVAKAITVPSFNKDSGKAKFNNIRTIEANLYNKLGRKPATLPLTLMWWMARICQKYYPKCDTNANKGSDSDDDDDISDEGDHMNNVTLLKKRYMGNSGKATQNRQDAIRFDGVTKGNWKMNLFDRSNSLPDIVPFFATSQAIYGECLRDCRKKKKQLNAVRKLMKATKLQNWDMNIDDDQESSDESENESDEKITPTVRKQKALDDIADELRILHHLMKDGDKEIGIEYFNKKIMQETLPKIYKETSEARKSPDKKQKASPKDDEDYFPNKRARISEEKKMQMEGLEKMPERLRNEYNTIKLQYSPQKKRKSSEEQSVDDTNKRSNTKGKYFRAYQYDKLIYPHNYKQIHFQIKNQK